MHKLKQALFIGGVKDGRIEEYENLPENIIVDNGVNYIQFKLNDKVVVYAPSWYTDTEILLALITTYYKYREVVTETISYISKNAGIA